MRRQDLKIKNLTGPEDVERVREIICGMTGARFVDADLDDQVVEFDMYQDLDDLNLTEVQCALRDEGFEAGEVVEGQTCTVRFKEG